MRTLLLLLVLALCGKASVALALPKAIVLVRHAERLNDTEDTPLSETGKARARALAQVLADLKPEAIYVTEFQRTQATAAPLVGKLSLTARIIPANQGDSLRKALVQHQGVVVVVHHSHLLPALLTSLGIAETITIAKDEYDNLFVVLPKTKGKADLMRLRLPLPLPPP